MLLRGFQRYHTIQRSKRLKGALLELQGVRVSDFAVRKGGVEVMVVEAWRLLQDEGPITESTVSLQRVVASVPEEGLSASM